MNIKENLSKKLDELIEKLNKNINNISQECFKGIKNIGNTCYINSTIQCFSNCPELRNFFLFYNPIENINHDNKLVYNTLVVKAFEYIIKVLCIKSSIEIDPFLLKETFGMCNKLFNNDEQHDIHELIIFLINSLHEGLNKNNEIKFSKNHDFISNDIENVKNLWKKFLSDNQSLIVDLFYGLLKSTIYCPTCNNISYNYDIFSTLSLNLIGKNDKCENMNDDIVLKNLKIIFLPYYNYEKPLLINLTFNNKIQISYKQILYKFSNIIRVEPYSLYIYPFYTKEIIIDKIFGINYFKNIDDDSINGIIICQINNNLIKSRLVLSDDIEENNNNKKSKEFLINNLKEKANEFINDLKKNIDENSDEFQIFNYKLLINYNIDLGKNYIFVLNNCISFLNKGELIHKSYIYPKLFIFPKTYSIFNLYFEIFNLNKYIILKEEYKKNINDKNILIDKIPIKSFFKIKFKYLFENNANSIVNKKFVSNSAPPFYLIIEIKHLNKKENNSEIILLLNDNKSKNKIKDVLLKYNDIKFPDLQLIIKIIWNSVFKKDLLISLEPENLNTNLNDLKNNKIKEEFINKKIQNECININNFNVSTIKKAKEIKNNKKLDLYDLFKIFSEEEILDDNNKWECSICNKKVKAKKKIELFHSPKILIIHLKRFNNDNQKINNFINYPINNLEINNFILTKNEYKKTIYDLFAICNHYGSISFGHYISICKNFKKNKWYEINDSKIKEINEAEIVNNNAYILFYRIKNLDKLNWNEIYNKYLNNKKINDISLNLKINDDLNIIKNK